MYIAFYYILNETYDCVLQYVQFPTNNHNIQVNNIYDSILLKYLYN